MLYLENYSEVSFDEMLVSFFIPVGILFSLLVVNLFFLMTKYFILTLLLTKLFPHLLVWFEG